ncbi:MAG TPA: alpha/beta hydrolase [Solirubrobacterales bacterium]|nr:alpha/beta hydrolase [Solirubrobacterales bacterium]
MLRSASFAAVDPENRKSAPDSQELIIETSTYTREDTTFESGGTACATWLYRPDGVERPPIIVMAHGFAAMRALRLAAYAERFAESGFAVLAFDYRGWGDSAGEPRRVLEIGSQQDDWRAALAFARALDGVDTSHVAAWGSSFGAGHVLSIAAEDHGLAAIVAQVPHISGPASAFAGSPLTMTRLALAGLRDQLGAAFGREPLRLPAAGEPGTLAMMTTPDATAMMKRLAGDRYEELLPQNDVAARIALRVPFYSPGRVAGRITCPALVQLAKDDVVTPYKVALKAARRIPGGEVLSYECGHFDPYVEPLFDTIVGDQIDFLRRSV